MKPKRGWLLAGLLLALEPTGAAAAEGGVASDPVWRYRRMDVEVRIDAASARFELQGTGVLELSGAGASEVRLFLNTRAAAMRFDTLLVRGEAAVELTESGNQRLALVRVLRPLEVGDSLVFDFAVTWQAPSSQLLVTDSIALASWVEAWYPIPVSGGAPQWAAPGSTRFRLPDGWHAVSNGRPRTESGSGGGGVQEWHTAEAVHRSFAAGPFRVARTRSAGREIGVYLLRADTLSAARQAAMLSRAVAAMEEVWGRYPYDSYAIAEVPTEAVTWAASSEQGFIMAVSSQFGDDGNLPLFAHEAAHAWWGNRVTSFGPGAQLVTESLAQYGAVVAIEALEGVDAMNEFLRFSRRGYNAYQSAHGYFEIVRRGGDKPLSQLTNDRWDHNLSDSKGHWFHHMLRDRVGDDHFFGVLRSVQHEYAGRVLSLAALRQAFVDATPQDPGLESFMMQWLDRVGAPVLEMQWWTPHDGRTVQIEIAQVQDVLYELTLTIELELLNGQRRRHRLVVTEPVHTFELETHSRVVGVVMDPDHRLLFWRPEYGPRPGR
jgi:hypothetical protein